MRRRPGQALRIEVSARALRVLRTSRWGAQAVAVLAERALAPSGAGSHEAIAQGLRAVLAECALEGWPANIVLADALARTWLVEPPAGAARMADLEAAAALRFQALFGESAAEWSISADWRLQQPFCASAVRRELLAALAMVGRECRLAVLGIAPQFVAAWNRWCRAIRDDAWFGQVHDGVLTLAVIDDGRLRAIRAISLAGEANIDWLSRAAAREALLHGALEPALLQLCGAVPVEWCGAGGAGLLSCVALGQDQGASAQAVVPSAPSGALA